MQLNTLRAPRIRLAGNVAYTGAFLVALLVLFVCTQAVASTSAGTVIENSASAQYDGGAVSSNSVAITVAQVAGVSLVASTTTQSGLPETTLYFPISLSNQGNGTDSFTLSINSQQGWVVALYRDDNNDGVHQSTEETSVANVENLEQDGTYRFFAAVTLPTLAADTQDTLTIRAQSAFDAEVFSAVVCTATIEQFVDLSISPTEALVSGAPGDIIYLPFTITNQGNVEDTYALSLSSDLGWPAAIIADDNQDGVHQASEIQVAASAGPLASGESYRAFVQVEVPIDLAATAQIVLDLSVASSADSAQSAQARYTVVGEVPLLGDIDGDGAVTEADADAAAQMALEAGTWTAEQEESADMDEDGNVDVADVLRILGVVTVDQTQLQIDGGGRETSLPTITATAGSVRNLAVDINDGAEVAGFQATLSLDTVLLDLLEVSAGILMGEDSQWEILYVIDTQEIRLLVYNNAGNPLQEGAGSLVRLNMFVDSFAQEGEYSDIIWTETILSDISGNEINPLVTNDGRVTVTDQAELLLSVCSEEDGAPIAGAEVEIWQGDTLVAQSLTDSSGDCLVSPLPGGSYDVFISAEDYYSESFEAFSLVEGELSEVTFALVAVGKKGDDRGAVEGFVVDALGNPIERATVRVYRNGRRVAQARTDATGYYCITGLLPGKYAFRIYARGYVSETQTLNIYAGEMVYGDVVLTAEE